MWTQISSVIIIRWYTSTIGSSKKVSRRLRRPRWPRLSPSKWKFGEPTFHSICACWIDRSEWPRHKKFTLSILHWRICGLSITVCSTWDCVLINREKEAPHLDYFSRESGPRLNPAFDGALRRDVHPCNSSSISLSLSYFYCRKLIIGQYYCRIPCDRNVTTCRARMAVPCWLLSIVHIASHILIVALLLIHKVAAGNVC